MKKPKKTTADVLREAEAKKAGDKLRANEGLEVNTSGEQSVITLKSTTVRTLEGALKEADVDRSIWEVEKHTINKWDQGQKHPVDGAQVVELWQVKVWLRRIAPKPITDAIERFFDEHCPPPKWPRATKAPTICDLSHLLAIALFDVHFGKLAWAAETGEDYDTKLAAEVFSGGVEDLLVRASGFRIDEIVFPVGNDFFHADNWIGTTAKGTSMDMDTRFAKVFDLGIKAVIGAIDECSKVAPVEVIYVPGNHDPSTAWYLMRVLDAWYRRSSRVTVDTSPKSRKYHRFGDSLLGFTHGDEEKHSALPAIMATEVPQDWAATNTRVWMIGHEHKKREAVYAAGDTYNGVRVVAIPSLSGTDAWHYRKGYVKTARAAEAWLFGRADGYVGHFSANVRKGAR